MARITLVGAARDRRDGQVFAASATVPEDPGQGAIDVSTPLHIDEEALLDSDLLRVLVGDVAVGAEPSPFLPASDGRSIRTQLVEHVRDVHHPRRVETHRLGTVHCDRRSDGRSVRGGVHVFSEVIGKRSSSGPCRNQQRPPTTRTAQKIRVLIAALLRRRSSCVFTRFGPAHPRAPRRLRLALP